MTRCGVSAIVLLLVISPAVSMAAISASPLPGVVAVVDSGVSPTASFWDAAHLDLWQDDVGGSATPVDDVGHGTAVSSIIAREDPGAHLAIDRIYSPADPITGEDIARAIRWSTHVAHAEVTLVAIWYPSPNEQDAVIIDAALQDAESNGNLVVWAAGNGLEGYGIPPADTLPGSGSAHSLVVGAADESGAPQAWSNAAPDLLAVGVNIPAEGADGFVVPRTGTSFASAWMVGRLASHITAGVSACQLRGYAFDVAREQPGLSRVLSGEGFAAPQAVGWSSDPSSAVCASTGDLARVEFSAAAGTLTPR